MKLSNTKLMYDAKAVMSASHPRNPRLAIVAIPLINCTLLNGMRRHEETCNKESASRSFLD